VPEAVVALKQGAGRLIRRESDQGVLVLCDNRLVTTGYGRRLMASLPPMRQLQTPEALAQSLDEISQANLTKASTTAFNDRALWIEKQGVGIGLFKHTLGVITQLVQSQFVVTLIHD
jgi:ATP-dependent DNA helicase DinG